LVHALSEIGEGTWSGAGKGACACLFSEGVFLGAELILDGSADSEGRVGNAAEEDEIYFKMH